MTEPLADPLGSVLKNYREQDLQLSQADLAWLADVSRGTISNLETGKVTPDERTWHRIRTTLALPMISPSQVRSRTDMRPMLPVDAVQGIIVAILNIRRRDAQVGSNVAERWRRLVNAMSHTGSVESETKSELTWLACDVAAQAPPSKLTTIYAALRNWGWTPDNEISVTTSVPSKPNDSYQLHSLIDTLTSSINRMAAQQQVFQEVVQGFERLPVRVQDLLISGLVVDWDVDRYDAAPNVAVVDLVLVDEDQTPTNARKKTHEVVGRWSDMLLLAKHLFDNVAPDLKPQEIIEALNRGLQIPPRGEIDTLRQHAHGGDRVAMYKLGKILLQRRQTEDAERWFGKAAEAGDPSAMLELGRMVEDQGRTRDAEYWFRRAAAAGHPGARSDLGRFLQSIGRVDEAESWLRSAAEAGNPAARYNLSLLISERGQTDEAQQWLRKAAEAGHSGAIGFVGSLSDKEQKQIGPSQ